MSAPPAPPFADASPAAEGFRWPAEWEPHRATWLSWPHNQETWPTQLAEVVNTFASMVEALVAHEQVCIGLADAAAEEGARAALRARGVDADQGVTFHHYATHDAWVRDHGPIFLVRDAAGTASARALVDFRFDNWGRKYPGWEIDDSVPEHVARITGTRRFVCGEVLEGGSIDGDGCGSILTTESCLLHPNRSQGGAPRTRESLEHLLADQLGARRVLWLGRGIEGDDTDGHVDDVARFAAPDVVVAAVCDDPVDPNHAPLAENRRRLESFTAPRGGALRVVELPMPPRLQSHFGRSPASYANFYVANGVVLVPVFGVSSDDRALSVLGELWPERDVRGIPCQALVGGLGAIHCATQQEPE